MDEDTMELAFNWRGLSCTHLDVHDRLFDLARQSMDVQLISH